MPVSATCWSRRRESCSMAARAPRSCSTISATAPATYRISVEFRRMTPDGKLEDVTEPTAQEKAAAAMIVYAPRGVTLAPREPQSIRIAARPPEGLPDGEYRVHLLFRAIPPSNPVT